MSKQPRGIVVGQAIVYSIIAGVVGFFGAVGVSHERRIDTLNKNMARSLAIQERVVEDAADNRQAIRMLLERASKR